MRHLNPVWGWPVPLSQPECEDRFFSYLSWQSFGDLHFVSVCCCWCPGVRAWPAVTQITAAHPAASMQTRPARVTMGTLNMMADTEESPSPLYLLWAGSGTMWRPLTWWPCGSWSAGFAKLVSAKQVCPQLGLKVPLFYPVSDLYFFITDSCGVASKTT